MSSLIISSVTCDLTSVSRAVVSNPLWGAPKKIMERTGSRELYILIEPLMSHSAFQVYQHGIDKNYQGRTTFLMIRHPKLWPMKIMGRSWHFATFVSTIQAFKRRRHTPWPIHAWLKAFGSDWCCDPKECFLICFHVDGKDIRILVPERC